MCCEKGTEYIGSFENRLLLDRATQGKLSGMIEFELVLKAEYVVLAQVGVQDIVPE